MRLLTFILSLCAVAALADTNDYSHCFVPGEVSEYKVTWMGIPLAYSRSETDTVTVEGRELIRIRMISKSYKAYTHLYAVDDKSEVLLDPKTALPVQLDFILSEGGREKSHFTTFDHAHGSATFIDRISHTTNNVAIEPDTREILTFLYSARARDLYQMQEQIHTVFVDGKIYEMGLQIHKEKRVKVPGVGKVACWQIEPLAEFDGIFLRQGKIFFWVSKQNRRMVTWVEAKVPVGKINVKLRKVAGPGDDFWVRKESDE